MFVSCNSELGTETCFLSPFSRRQVARPLAKCAQPVESTQCAGSLRLERFVRTWGLGSQRCHTTNRAPELRGVAVFCGVAICSLSL